MPKKIIADNDSAPDLQFKKTRSDKITLFITNVFGSIGFLFACLFIFVFWMVWNFGMLPMLRPVDKYPFPVLELVVSLFAIVLSVSVLISQNRERKMEKIREKIEFEVNVRAEREITKVLSMLHDIQKHMGIAANDDNELEGMKEPIDVHQLHRDIDDMKE